MNRLNTVDCSSTSVAAYNQEFTARTPKSQINQTEPRETGRLQNIVHSNDNGVKNVVYVFFFI